MVNKTTISVQEDSQGRIVATDDATEIQAKGGSRWLALATLAEKLEMELFRERNGERPTGERLVPRAARDPPMHDSSGST